MSLRPVDERITISAGSLWGISYNVDIKRLLISNHEEYWVEYGLTCFLRISNMIGIYCGYVAVRESHPLFGINYNEASEQINVHGGLTFSDVADELGWAFGFDCGHYMDSTILLPDMGGTFKNASFVRSECKSLARQLKEVGE